MRLGVIDVGSNTVHLLVVDARFGAAPIPASSHKRTLRLSEHTTAEGLINQKGVDSLTAFVRESIEIAEDLGIRELLSFVTSAIREAPNGEDVLAAVESSTGHKLTVLSGVEEARLTYLATRRWFGWSKGRLLNIDIGGGSLELSTGMDEVPDAAVSVPLGAGRLTRTLKGDPPSQKDLRDLRFDIRAQIADVVGDLIRWGHPDHVAGTSKTIRSLARACGAASSSEGPFVPRFLARDDLAKLVPKLAKMSASERTKIPGVSKGRSSQVLAGSMVVLAAMELLEVPVLEVCPWALREGVILRKLDSMD